MIGMSADEKQKGQDLIEYAFLLALIVAVGGRHIFCWHAAFYFQRFCAGRFASGRHQRNSFLQFLLMMILLNVWGRALSGTCGYTEGDPDGQAVDIDSDSATGQQLAQKLNIQTKDGDGWFARVNTNGYFIVSYYSADANKGVTFNQLKSDYKDNPGKYGKDPVTSRYKTTFKINEGYYYPNGDLKTYNTVGHIETSPNGSGMSIYPGAR